MCPLIDRDGIPIAWSSQGDRDPAVLLMPTWAIAPARMWKLQVPYLARHHRVLTFDPRGAGGSGRPPRAEDYADDLHTGDALAVLDAAGVDAAFVVALSCAGRWAVPLAAEHPGRVLGMLLIAPALPLAPQLPERAVHPFEEDPGPEAEGWAKDTRAHRRRAYGDYLDFFFAQMFCEPHSTRQQELSVGWGADIGAATLELTDDAPMLDAARTQAACRAVRCPVTVLHPGQDRISPRERSARAARLMGGTLVDIPGGHGPHVRHPVRIGALIHAAAERAAGREPPAPAPRPPATASRRPPRVLVISSPIGLGHVRRDLAIARELRRVVPGVEIDWLAQAPVRDVVAAAGEHVHPMSRHLLGEADHIDAWAGEHELWVFEALRRMEEVLTANYLVFRDLTRAEPYDLWVADEAWEVDHHLHEHPVDKRAAYAWLSDFVGWLPLPEHGEQEARLAADLNEEMIGHVADRPGVRDLSLLVGDADDLVPDAFGPGLPPIRDWTEAHFAFIGQIVERAPDAPEATRANGRSSEGPLCLVSVGGSGVGEALIRRAVAALPELRRRVPGARMRVVCGPRVDPASVPHAAGLELAGHVGDLGDLLACDAALVHGGLSTGMELVAAGLPFVSVPLQRHFEQLRHVRHRLARHGHARTLAYPDATPERLARELADALASGPPAYVPVDDGGAARAAARLAELL